MYFTLAVSASTREGCAALVSAAIGTDPRVMPIPGPPAVAWEASSGLACVLRWPGPAAAGVPGPAAPARTAAGRTPVPGHQSQAGTIWADQVSLRARTTLTRVDPVYLAEVPGAVIVSDRASWAAAVSGRLGVPDPVTVAAFLSLGYPVGTATPFRGVRALGGAQQLTVTGGRLAIASARAEGRVPGEGGGPYRQVADALIEAVRPLGELGGPVELSLTGGKDSRLVVAALTAAKVPFRARTHGFATHPDVIVAAMIASRLGVEHVVTEPRAAAPEQAPDETELVARLRSAVLVCDGMLSAFENLGRPDPQRSAEPVQAGGHGGELLRGGYAPAAWTKRSPARAWSEARGAELFRRMVTRRLGLLHPAAAGEYLASLAPFAAALRRGPLHALDEFYLVNRAGRWSAAARQAYLLRSPMAQPLFDDQVVRAARAVPLEDRITDRLHRGVLAELCPDLLDLPLAGSEWKSGPRIPPVRPAPSTGPSGSDDWRRGYGEQMARLLREYALDVGAASGMFGLVRRAAAERVLRPPQRDTHAVWALATLAALLSGDWLNARDPAQRPVTLSSQ
jgi:hypothetical protein